jgi:SulP family sulfate permease
VIILFGAPVIELLPIAALVVMIMVAIGTFEWFRIINKMPKHDIFVGLSGHYYYFIT